MMVLFGLTLEVPSYSRSMCPSVRKTIFVRATIWWRFTKQVPACITYLSFDLSSSHRADQCVRQLQGSAQPPQRAHLLLLIKAPPRRHSRSPHPPLLQKELVDWARKVGVELLLMPTHSLCTQRLPPECS